MLVGKGRLLLRRQCRAVAHGAWRPALSRKRRIQAGARIAGRTRPAAAATRRTMSRRCRRRCRSSIFSPASPMARALPGPDAAARAGAARWSSRPGLRIYDLFTRSAAIDADAQFRGRARDPASMAGDQSRHPQFGDLLRRLGQPSRAARHRDAAGRSVGEPERAR